MLIDINCIIHKKEIQIDYRPALVSLFKYVLLKEYSNYYKKWYENGVSPKGYTFSVALSNPEFEEKLILLKSEKVKISVSSSNEEEILVLYNSFIKNIGYEHPLINNGTLKIISVNIKQSTSVLKDNVKIKFLSPLVVRNHEKGQKDYYYIFSDEEFQENLKHVASRQIGQAVNIKLSPIYPKKTVVKAFQLNIRASIGTFILEGKPDQITYFANSGIGSRRNEGFGMFEILKGC